MFNSYTNLVCFSFKFRLAYARKKNQKMNLKRLLILLIIGYFSLSNLEAQEITMFAGFWGPKYYQDAKQINKKQLENLLEKDAAIYKHWQRSKNYETLAWVAIGVEAGFAAWEISDPNNRKNNTATAIGVFGSLITGTVFVFLSNGEKKKSILKHNKSIQKSTSFTIKPSGNGLSLVLQF